MSPAKLWRSCLVFDQLNLQQANPHAWPVDDSWQSLVNSFWGSAQGQSLQSFLTERLDSGARIFPPTPLQALLLTPLHQVHVVILGQDPYHGAGQAEGLSFSVPAGVALPPSLKNIYKELQTDVGLPSRTSGSLVPWAQRGVLLLNTCLTVEEGSPASHAGKGWETLTDAIISAVAKQPQPVVYLLWGAHAQAKRTLLENSPSQRRLVLTANHPSPLAALRQPTPFIGCRHFSRAQTWLRQQGVVFNWELDSTG